MKKQVVLVLVSLMSTYQPIQSCSIVGYVGNTLCKAFIQQGLGRLEYRGYDSAGFACLDPVSRQLSCIKAEGKLEKLKEKLKKDTADGFIGIGHTRWATHGAANEVNAHPHTCCDNSLAVVHNGIIENHFVLKQGLVDQWHTFTSETDTEVIAHLLKDCISRHLTLLSAVVETAQTLHGAYGFVAITQDHPDTLIVVRKSSPICIGINEHEKFVASDFLAFAGKTDQVLFLPDESIAIVTKDALAVYDFYGNLLPQDIKTIEVSPAVYEKFEHEHFMLKEIYEQRTVIHATVDYYRAHANDVWQQLNISPEQIKDLKSIHLFGCGTSWHAARIAQFFFEIICGIPTSTHLASEF